MEAIRSSESLVTTYKITWCNNPDDKNRHEVAIISIKYSDIYLTSWNTCNDI
jgi:hypothetical protein